MREWDVGDKRGMRGRGMREAHLSAVSAAVMVLGCSGAAYAADLGNMVTKAPPAPPGPATCNSIEDFFTTACQLSWNGVRFYGTVDVGGGYETNGAPFAKFAGAGVNYFLGKPNLGGKWLPSPPCSLVALAPGRYPTCSRSWVLQQHSFSGRDDQGAQES
jgi:hypothetical protein